MSTPPISHLESDITGKYAAVAGFAELVRSALGSGPGAPMTSESVDLVAYMIRPAPQVLTTWLLAPTGFTVCELARSEQQLIVSIPLWRVRRVVEATADGNLNGIVEIESDRTVTEIAPGATEGTQIGTTTSSSYSVTAPMGAPETAQVALFLREFRRVLSGS